MMNIIKKTAFIFGFIVLFASCTEDESANESCYTCESTQTEYCYTIGDSYYVTTDADGATHHTELNGASWSDTQDFLENQCNGTTEDCYTCTATNTEYCYTEGNSFYTLSINGAEDVNMELNGALWTDLRAGFEANCDDSSTGDFDILGTWKMIDIHGTSTNVVTFNDPDISSMTSITTQTMISSDVEINFIEDNTYTVTGSAQIHSVTTTDGVETSNFDYDSNPENGGWQINGDQITISTNGTESTGTIINQSDTHFTIKSIIHNSQDNAAGNSTTDAEFFQVYEKQ